MVLPKPAAQRLNDLGPAQFFRPEALDPAVNQVRVKAGFALSGGREVFDKFSAGDQLTTGFSVVTSGFRRYDLVYIDDQGVVAIAAGTELASATPAFEGAPGWDGGGTKGPDLPNNANPVAWVRVDEVATVIIDDVDITQLNGFVRIANDLIGETIDKGFFGSAPTGLDDIVTSLFAGEVTSGGAVRGVVTSGATNYTRLLNQANDEIKNNLVSGARVYGRLTEAAGVWTLSYFFIDDSGVEQTVDPSTLTPAPTDVRLVAVPKIFSINDPIRPLFDSQFARLSDQVAGDIPLATETAPGKVQLAADLDTAANEVVQGNDTRLAQPIQAEDSGGSPIGARYSALREGANISLTDLGGGKLGVAIAASSLVDRDRVETDQIDTTTLNIPTDGTPPQNTEGKELLSKSFTPKTIGNKIVIRAFLQVSSTFGADVSVTSALFAAGRTIGPDAVGTGFAFTGTTISRNDGGDWLADGFRLGDDVTIANAEDVANDGIHGPITTLTATVMTISSATFVVNADDTTVTFSPDSNALSATHTLRQSAKETPLLPVEAELLVRSLAALTFSVRYGGSGGTMRVNARDTGASIYGPAGIAFLAFAEFRG